NGSLLPAQAAALDLGSIHYTAAAADSTGNNISVEYKNPLSANAALSVSVVGNAITVNLATDNAGAIQSTAGQVAAAVNANLAAHALVTASAVGAGTGLVAAIPATRLAGAPTE